MNFLEALILGIIQGLTEFLPVSSSGHLELAKAIQGQELSAESSMMMTVVVHAATALSTVFVFRKDILDIFKGLFQFKANEQTYFSLKIILSMIPAAIVGLFFNDMIESWFSGQILLVGSMLIVTGLLLFLADRAKDSGKDVGFGHAAIIGIAQAIAILPGISRSGATIGTSVLLGIDRSKAARFSFLMVVPLILGKMVDDLRKGDVGSNDVPSSMLIVGFIAAFFTGIFACKWMIALVKRSKLSWFSYYCLLVGTAAILWNFLA
jgi:undecaprenyl-diphosphatase